MGQETKMVSREMTLSVIERLRKEYAAHYKHLDRANEAETRLLLIDEVLQALGWSKDSFNPEESAGQAGYLDYLLRTDAVPRLIVEAKKFGHTFGLPRGQRQRNHYQLRSLRSSYGQPLTDVLEQARRYAMETKVPFAVLTNGGEWILAQLTRTPGYSSVDELQAVYFGNLLKDDFRFGFFWDLLSRSRVEQGEIESYFADINSKEADYCRSPQSTFGVLQWSKDSDLAYIREFYDRFFDEIIDPRRRAMLERCFVTNSELDHYQGELQRTLRDSGPTFLGDAIEISPEERDRLVRLDTGDMKGRVILVTGSVGCGKTTLVHKVLVEAKQDDSLMCVVINLINEIVSERIDIADVLWRYLDEEWRNIDRDSYTYDELTKIFQGEIARLKAGPQARLFLQDQAEYIRQEALLLEQLSSNPSKFLTACWRYRQRRHKGIVVVFDNVDRASQRYQEQVYAFAHQLADTTGATVILTMREFTFFRGREAGFLDVRSSDVVFHLKSPNLLQILSKRIRYVEDHLDGDYRVSQWRRTGDLESFRTAAHRHSQMLKKVFLLDKEGQQRLGVLEAIGWHNVRSFFEALRQVHVALGNHSKPWDVPEIIAALMTPQTQGRPILHNIYRPSYPHFKCYFLKLRLLLLLIYGQQEYETRRGTSYDRLITLLRLYGYHVYWIKTAIAELVRERFLECLEAPTEEEYTKDYDLQPTHSFRPSPLAVVLVEQLAAQPVYLSLIGNDLPFHSPHNFKQYKDALSEVYEAIGSRELERDAVDLLPNPLGQIVAKYLVGMFEAEQPPQNLLNYIPEIGATEDKLSRIVRVLRTIANVSVPAVKRYHDASTQPSLFPDIAGLIPSSERSRIPIPSSINSLTIGRSEQGPLIFWALVQLRAEGITSATGVEITNVINVYLVGDHEKKAPNNISRALRSATLQNQPWLLTIPISERKKSFALRDGWEQYWLALFGSTPPMLGHE